MATATQKAGLPQEQLVEIMSLLGGIPEADMAIFKERLERRAKVKEQGAYHAIVKARCFPKPGHPIPELPGGQYETYQITAGKHYRVEKSDMELARKEYRRKCAEAEAAKVGPPPFPEVGMTEYCAKQNITPQDDGEAFMMVQDPEKFRPLRGEMDKIAEMLAEQNALRQGAAAKDAEIARLMAELAEAKKKAPNGRQN
jgi:hypothetical protein